MSPATGLVLLIICLLITIFVSPKLNVNMGITAMILTFILGHWIYGISSTSLIALFPTRLVFTFILATFFFGYVKRAGVFKGIGDRILYAFRNKPALLPFAIIIAAYIISMSGAGSGVTPVIMSPIAFALAETVGFSPLVACFAAFTGAMIGTNTPWSASTAIDYQYVGEDIGAEYVNSTIWANHLTLWIVMIVVFLILFFATRSYKPKNVANHTISKPEPFSSLQKQVLWVVLAFVVLVAVPPIIQTILPNPVTAWMKANLDTYFLFLAGIFACNALKIADMGTVIKEDIAWSPILMLAGTGMLVALITPMGIIDWLVVLISENVPEALIHPMLTFAGGALTLCVNGTVALQALAPIFISASAQYASLPMVGTYMSLKLGIGGPTFSPFSTGGVMALLGCTDEKVRNKLVPQMFGIALFQLVVCVILSALGWFRLFTP